ncbi:MAG: pilus assembly PilX N-terminal domain-containing protein [Deltaproteobacteria bacterium]|nr:pilus assembly PilX N-terminal domain-containing protein [Deltaproteobacteria bacterium]
MSASHNERGSVMVVTLMLALVLTGIGITALYTSRAGSTTVTNQTRRNEALWAAQAGIARAREILGKVENWNELLSGTGCSGSFVSGKGRELCDDSAKVQEIRVVPASSATAGAASGLEQITFTVYIRNDDDEAAVDGEVDSDRRVIVRSEGRGRGGLAVVSLEAVLNSAFLGAGKAPSYSQVGLGAGGGNAFRQSD